ncbi:MAG: hypothetical protein JO250_02485 [Armatimonadetes bacterium]|nr:hypothetical protein [Armatimonadota bacterium]
MTTTDDPTAQTLTWVKPSPLHGRYELREGEDVRATLQRRSAFGTLADAEAAEGRWTFKRVGFLPPRVTVRDAGANTEAAVFQVHWDGSGELTLNDGRRFMWQAANFWHSQWTWTDAEGTPLLHFRPVHLSWHEQAQVEVSPAALVLPECSLLALLGWYLTLLRAADANNSAGAIAVAASS